MDVSLSTTFFSSFSSGPSSNQYNNPEKFITLIKQNSINEVLPYLKNKNFKYYLVKEESSSFSAIQLSIYYNYTALANYLIKYLPNEEKKQYLFTEENSPLHLASLRGNTCICEILLNEGADINQVSKNGLNVLHFAAQGNQPKCLLYFVEKYKLDINSRDFDNNNILHWACYFSSYSFVKFLMMMYKEECKEMITAKNNDGYTPMHLAVFSDNSKIIKRLYNFYPSNELVNAKDNYNQKPRDLARLKHLSCITEIENIEEKIFFNKITIQPNPVLYFIIRFFTVSFFFFLLYTIDNTKLSFSIKCILATFSFVELISYLFAKFSSPGFICSSIPFYYSQKISLEKNKELLLNMVDDNEEIERYCPLCMVDLIVNEKSKIKHCFKCNKCVIEYDHHCDWINNCIGKNNIGRFFCFVSFTLLNIAINITISLIAAVSPKNHYPNFYVYLLLCILFIMYGLYFFIVTIFIWYSSLKKIIQNVKCKK